MELRNEIKDVILLAAQRVLSNTAGDLSAADEARLRANLEGRIPLYTERYPILGLLNELDAVADAGHAAAVATNAAIKQQRGIPNLGWDDELGKFHTPITDQWTNAIRESAAEAAEEYFRKASTYFEKNRREQATECLCTAIICSIAATAALLGWPHRDRDDDLRTVVALATGSLPAEGESVYKLLQSASQQGQDLNSAFAAAMGQPDAVRTGAYQEAGRTNDEAFLFARTAVTLADQLGRSYDDTQRTTGYQPGVLSTLRPGIRQRRQHHDCRRTIVGSSRTNPDRSRHDKRMAVPRAQRLFSSSQAPGGTAA